MSRPRVLRTSPLGPEDAEIYVVSWETGDDTFTKVGLSLNQRWRAFISRGGRPALILRVHVDDVVQFEHLCHAVMGFEANRRFSRPTDAAPYLGGRGAGFSECYDAHPEHVVRIVTSLADRYLYENVQVAI